MWASETRIELASLSFKNSVGSKENTELKHKNVVVVSWSGPVLLHLKQGSLPTLMEQ